MSNNPPNLEYSAVAPKFRYFRYLRLSLVVMALTCITMAMYAVQIWLVGDNSNALRRSPRTTRAVIVFWLIRNEVWPMTIALLVAVFDLVIWTIESLCKNFRPPTPDMAVWLRIIFNSTSVVSLLLAPSLAYA